MSVRDERLLPWPRPPDGVRQMLADYYRYISYLDSLIGQVLDALEATHLNTNTFVVFSADSGVARGSHGLIGKQNLYEHSLRVPLIIAGPGIPAGRRTEGMCYLFDVLPTLGKLAGVRAPPGSEGLDFSATLRDPEKPARPRLVFAYKNVQRALRDERWKLIRYPEVDQTQLFDLQNDPQETKNLAGQTAYTDKVQEMMARLKEELSGSGDSAPLRVPNPKPSAWTPPAN
jgi:arylsulfatase A-like enzyme